MLLTTLHRICRFPSNHRHLHGRRLHSFEPQLHGLSVTAGEGPGFEGDEKPGEPWGDMEYPKEYHKTLVNKVEIWLKMEELHMKFMVFHQFWPTILAASLFGGHMVSSKNSGLPAMDLRMETPAMAGSNIHRTFYNQSARFAHNIYGISMEYLQHIYGISMI